MRKGQKTSEKTKEKIRQSNLGKKHNISEEGYKKLKMNGIGGWNKGKKLSDEWREKIRQTRLGKTTSDKHKEIVGLNWLGEKNPRWKGGKKFWKTNEKKHLSSKYIDWVKRVKKRDNWKCRMENKDCHGRLEAHHILNWIDFSELRYDMNNGITLCQFHHPRKKIKVEKMILFFQQLIKNTIT